MSLTTREHQNRKAGRFRLLLVVALQQRLEARVVARCVKFAEGAAMTE